MDAKVVSWEWGVEVDFADGEVPDTQKEFTSLIFRPKFAFLTFEAGPGQTARFYRALVSGPRVLKSGRLGVMVDASYFPSTEPAWLENVIDHAKGVIRG